MRSGMRVEAKGAPTTLFNVCEKCQHNWIAQQGRPARCPSCGSRRWDKESKPEAVPEGSHETVAHHHCLRCNHEWDGPFRATCPSCLRPRWFEQPRETKAQRREREAVVVGERRQQAEHSRQHEEELERTRLAIRLVQTEARALGEVCVAAEDAAHARQIEADAAERAREAETARLAAARRALAVERACVDEAVRQEEARHQAELARTNRIYAELHAGAEARRHDERIESAHARTALAWFGVAVLVLMVAYGTALFTSQQVRDASRTVASYLPSAEVLHPHYIEPARTPTPVPTPMPTPAPPTEEYWLDRRDHAADAFQQWDEVIAARLNGNADVLGDYTLAEAREQRDHWRQTYQDALQALEEFDEG